MRLLYISKHRYIRKADGRVFSTGAMGEEYFRRFLSVFDSVTVLGYVQDSDGLQGVGAPVCDTEHIRFLLCPCGKSRLRPLLTDTRIRALARKEAKCADAIACKSASGAAFAAATAKETGRPYLVEVVGCVRDALRNHGLAGKLLAYPSFFRLRSVILHAPFVCYVTDRFLQSRYPTRGTSAGISDVLLPGADAAVLETRLERIKAHGGVLRIGTVGAVDIPYKGQRYVIEALALLKRQGRCDFEYHLVGSGDPAALRVLAEKLGVGGQVVFDGSLPHGQIFPWLDSLDLYIQPSLVEAMPRALIEAMSRALPCYGSEVGGIPELLEASCRFAPHDPRPIAALLSGADTQELLKHSACCFARAKAFERSVLEARRNDFYAAFAALCEESKNE